MNPLATTSTASFTLFQNTDVFGSVYVHGALDESNVSDANEESESTNKHIQRNYDRQT